ncbi:MAG: aldolase [Sulfurovum sp. AS07-7]|nr:MAG: aldolase [Sulfurovum sp. AS07-7]
MVFKSLDFIEKLSPEERVNHFGANQKAPLKQKKVRSNMMLNPLNLKHLNRLDELKADMVTLNLEDAIAPSRKKEALYNIALFLSHLKASKTFIIIRTNPIDEGGYEEIEFLNEFKFDAVRIPKVKTAHEVEVALKILESSKELHLSLETKEAFSSIKELKIDPRVTTLNLGILDLLHSLNLPQSLLDIQNPSIEYILSKFLVESKTHDFLPISFMFQDYKNITLFKQWLHKEKMMGFGSKACMGPLQVEEVNQLFSSSSDEIYRAKRIKELFEEHSLVGVNGFLDNEFGFIDEPIYKDALLVLGA